MRSLLPATWCLALLQLLTLAPAAPLTIPEPLSLEWALLLAAFLATSVALLPGRRSGLGVALHLLVVGTLIVLHPFSAVFGRDGSLVALGAHFFVVLRSRSRVQKEWQLLGLSLFVGALAAEAILAARGDPARRRAQGLPDYGDVMGEYHEAGFLKPNLDLRVVGEEGPVRFVTNARGLRNQEPVAEPKPPGTYRVFFIGDSFVSGYRTDQDRTVGKRLEDELRRRLSRPVEVLVAGAGHPGKYLDLVEGGALGYEPDLVLVGITLGNDISQAWFHPRGVSADTGAQLLLPADAFRTGAALLPVKLDRSLRSWRTYRLLSGAFRPDVITSWHGDVPTRVHVFDAVHSLGHFFARGKLGIVEESFGDLFDDLRAMDRRCRSAGVGFIAALLPQRFQVSDREWNATLFEYGLDPAAFERELPNRRILAFGREAGVPCLDLLPAFRAAGPGPLYQARGDMHWNDRGHAVAARALAERIGAEAGRGPGAG